MTAMKKCHKTLLIGVGMRDISSGRPVCCWAVTRNLRCSAILGTGLLDGHWDAKTHLLVRSMQLRWSALYTATQSQLKLKLLSLESLRLRVAAIIISLTWFRNSHITTLNQAQPIFALLWSPLAKVYSTSSRLISIRALNSHKFDRLHTNLWKLLSFCMILGWHILIWSPKISYSRMMSTRYVTISGNFLYSYKVSAKFTDLINVTTLAPAVRVTILLKPAP